MRRVATTFAIASLLGICFVTRANSAHTRPVQVRISWLQHRVSQHKYICHYGAHQTQRWHCMALKWSRRELQQALKEKQRRWHQLPSTNDWGNAVKITQRVYSGTAAWLLSCSHGEGGHGRWVRYGGGSYYPGYERTDAVGNWMQFRPSTFRPYWRLALADMRRRGFYINDPGWLKAWLSPLPVALTAAYMRKVAGNSHWHWKASIDRGCA